MARNQVADTTATSSKKGSKKTEATSPKSKTKTKTKNKNTKNNTLNTNTNANEDPKPSTSNQIQHQEEEEEIQVEVEVEANSNNNNKLSNKKEDKKKKNQNNNKKKKMDVDVDEEEENKNNENALYNFPMNRINRIVKAESDVRITQEALFLINKASEKFLQLFTTEAFACSFLDKKKHIGYQHLSSAVGKRRRFDFLSDFVPEKVKVEDALKETPSVEM
ncbi:hypothetical protein LguiA_012232 [Lonicera macranthoides]